MIVTVDEVKTHLRIEHNEEDEYIETLIKQSFAAFHRRTGQEGHLPANHQFNAAMGKIALAHVAASFVSTILIVKVVSA